MSHLDADAPARRVRGFELRRDDLRGEAIAALLREHLAWVRPFSPPESIHALDLDGLRSPDVDFFSAWDGDDLVGCGALRRLDAGHGEIKSMRTAEAHRRRGVGAAVLEHLLVVARQRGFRRMSLETGAHDAFAPARALYERAGFRPCDPFGDYHADRHSVFLTLELASNSPEDPRRDRSNTP